MRRLQFVCFSLSFTLLLLLVSSIQAQTLPAKIFVTFVDETQFPQISLRFRALDEQGKPLFGVTPDAITVTEDGQPVLLDGLREVQGGLWIHFVVDAGVRMNQADRWESTKQGILNFVQTTPWIGPDDRVSVSAIQLEDSIQLVGFTTDGEALASALDSYNPPCRTNDCLSRPLPVLERLLDDLDLQEESRNLPKFIIFFTGELERGTGEEAVELGQKAAALGIPVYTVLVNGQGNTQPIVDLGQQSGGLVTFYDDETDINNTYRQLTDQYRRQFEISYRSPSGNSGLHTIRMTTTDGTAVAEAIYQVDVAPPRVTVNTPGDGDMIVCDSPDLVQNVETTAVFTDNHPRNLSQATLLVNGQPVEAESIIQGNQVIFNWIPCAGESGEVTLEVEVMDELGLLSPRTAVTLQLDIPTPQPEITETPVVTATISTVEVQPTEEPETESAGIGTETIILIVSIILLLAAVGLVIANRRFGVGESVRQTMVKGFERLTKRVTHSQPKAFLIVLEGDTSVGKHLELFGTTTIGRSKQDANLLFQQYDEGSPISRRHCTVIDEEDHFTIRDEDSANGTYVNGVRLTAMVPKELQDGDEIELARVERGGVKLEFQNVQPSIDDTMSSDFRSTRATRATRATKAVRIDKDSGDRF